MHDHVQHSDLAAYAAEKVNVPADKAKARRDQVTHLRTRLQSYIADHPDYDLVKMRASGSVAKHTAIRSSSDTDIAAYVRASAVGGVMANEADLLAWLRERCIEVYGATKDASDFEISQHAVAITMHGSGLKIDVAPVLYEDEPDDRGYLVTRNGERVLTSVTLHLAFLNKRKTVAGAEYKEFIRLVKAFIARAKMEAAATGPELRFKSFLAELIVAHLYDHGWNGQPLAVKDYPQAFEQFLAYIVHTGLKQPIQFTDYYAASAVGASNDPVRVWDPVNPDNNVAGSYTDSDRQRIVDRCAKALDQITWAGMAPTKTAAVDAWRTLLGPSFPGA
ncbi:nucleotidyltransferase [Nocardioides carbamazepini]|uniref:CBASS oligonucleotide cyclase n=1 Tax=Nocardioides carbamazepini TaxID=2854259 RepID=UPI002149EDCA|nr:CBASS oligonucleotide cyclase [Nocardioides carbamazepini]MCR1785481.1 nucleotidyltransferase [Nocardioides carbamazepini]